jgi:hypothetical protein
MGTDGLSIPFNHISRIFKVWKGMVIQHYQWSQERKHSSGGRWQLMPRFKLMTGSSSLGNSLQAAL